MPRLGGSRRVFFGFSGGPYTFDPLPNGAKDVRLVRRGFDALGFECVSRFRVGGKGDVSDLLEEARAFVDEGTEVIVGYVCGHGVMVSNGHVRMLLGRATGYKDMSPEAGIQIGWLWERLMELPSRADALVVLIQDFCRVRIDRESLEVTNAALTHLQRTKVSISACAVGMPASDGRAADESGPLARSLARHLAGGGLTTVQLCQALSADVRSYSQQPGWCPQEVVWTHQGPGGRLDRPGDLAVDRRFRLRAPAWGSACVRGVVAAAAFAVLAAAAAYLALRDSLLACRLGPWGEFGACTASCGGGTATRARSLTRLARAFGRCSGERLERRACSSWACPAPSGCCRTCDLRCWDSSCEPLVALDTDAATCVFDDVARSTGDGILITWGAVVLGRQVEWRWRFACGGIHCAYERKRHVRLRLPDGSFETEDGDYKSSWEDSTKKCLVEFARHLGFASGPAVAELTFALA